MALLTYSDLLAQVPTWLARTGDATITGSVADWITLCEQRVAYGSDPQSAFPSQPLRIRSMETAAVIVLGAAQPALTVTGTASAISITVGTPPSAYATGQTFSLVPIATSTGALTLNVSGLGAVTVLKGSSLSAIAAGDLVAGATYNFCHDGTQFVLMPGSATAPLPSGYLASREMYIDAVPRDYLDYMVPDVMNRRYPFGNTGRPRAYTVEADALRFAPAPDSTYYLRMLYYKKFGALATAGTNWLMTNAPAVYLYGTLLEAAPFIGHDERLPLWHGLYRAACDGLQRQDERDRHSGALLTIQVSHSSP